MRRLFSLIPLLICSSFFQLHVYASDLPEHIARIKPSIVAIGLLNPTASPRIKLLGTGFVVGDGTQIATNYHVIAKPVDQERMEQYVVLSGQGEKVNVHPVRQRHEDLAHDLALLTIADTLPALSLSSKGLIAEGSAISLTGYPITSVLGLYPATHSGIIAAHSPVVIPAHNSQELQTRAIRALKAPYLVYQLDVTAYPGNSGSPLFSMADGKVIGIINQVHVKTTKEAVLSDPSGITYAIPVAYLQALLNDETKP
ncbi:S1 family peptidase [Rheinheimera baltica]|uniref:S1 family peptidase n=1 Tax=Rheinheimera baltica TaxID=67576 RepID=UPI00273EF4D2|nr:serine protease [Rheinheimera baltica]MDP5148773.1 serine protease [Rheinheimera baltica]MDP5190510.1 serine protease [Rheinheimera baltica]